MNICEAVRKMKPLQKVSSKSLSITLILNETGNRLRYVKPDGSIGGKFGFTSKEFLADDWEIEREYVDFWTAWQAYKNGKRVTCELWNDNEVYLNSGFSLNEDEINAKWLILD